jgi:aspartokinase/homoserine dehydrogenase 1
MAAPSSDPPFHVFKFGGTSVATPERIRQVVSLVQAAPSAVRRVVVVSALGGVTDQLLRAIDEALARSGAHPSLLAALRQRHEEALVALARPEEQARLRLELDALWHNLGELLDGVSLLRECTPRTRDAIIGTGERASTPLVAAAFRAAGEAAVALDASRFVRTDATFGEANVLFDQTNYFVQDAFKTIPPDSIACVTGFIGATEKGVLTTLGRSGSDYSATIVAGALRAERVVIWTDVDGVLSADPRLVPEAFTLPHLSYREAAEMAYFGAKVLHPRTMRPLQEQAIPLYIQNTLNPAAPGTLIQTEPVASEAGGHVKAVSTVRGMALVMLEGTGMMGIPGIAARAFSALALRQINVLTISQASSEQSICIGVREAEAETAVQALSDEFTRELERRDISQVYALPGCAVVSVVGDQMRHQPGLAGRMFSTLGRSNINVLAIAQGASETNISAVVHDAEVRQALQALHNVFAQGLHRAHLFLFGTGGVGRALLDILAMQAPLLRERMRLDLRLVGLANTHQTVWMPEGIPFGEALARLEAAPGPLLLDNLFQHLHHSHLERLIVVDTTASEGLARRYPDLLQRGIAVVTPNKRANTLEYPFYRKLQDLSYQHQVPFLYETTVGASLPVISTLRDLVRSGDRIRRFEGVLSGTLGYVFNRMAEGVRFSEAVQTARHLGYTEPDPRDDLTGEDVARKLLTLARDMDLVVERADIEVTSLVPPGLQEAPVALFMARLAEVDADWQARLDATPHHRLHYIARIEDEQLRIGIEAVGPDSPFARLRGTDNMIVFTTDRFSERPLVIQGAGAGPAITAAGVLSDLIKAASVMA